MLTLCHSHQIFQCVVDIIGGLYFCLRAFLRTLRGVYRKHRFYEAESHNTNEGTVAEILAKGFVIFGIETGKGFPEDE